LGEDCYHHRVPFVQSFPSYQSEDHYATATDSDRTFPNLQLCCLRANHLSRFEFSDSKYLSLQPTHLLPSCSEQSQHACCVVPVGNGILFRLECEMVPVDGTIERNLAVRQRSLRTHIPTIVDKDTNIIPKHQINRSRLTSVSHKECGRNRSLIRRLREARRTYSLQVKHN